MKAKGKFSYRKEGIENLIFTKSIVRQGLGGREASMREHICAKQFKLL